MAQSDNNNSEQPGGPSHDQQHDALHEALKQARRERQRKEAEIIGAGGVVPPRVTKVTVEQALKRFVFISNGSRVVDLTAQQTWMAMRRQSK